MASDRKEPEGTEFLVPPEAAGQRVRLFLRDALPLEPERLIDRLLSEGKVVVGDEPWTRKRTLRKGEVVSVRDLEREIADFVAPTVPAVVLYEDRDLLVLDKPAGCTVVRRRAAAQCPFQNGILAYLKRSPETAEAAARERYRPRALHRLDRPTTGVVMEAKTRAGELRVSRQFQNGQVEKEYLAVVRGELRDDAGEIAKPISTVPNDIARMQIGGPRAKASRTTYEVMERFRGITYVRVRLHTGRRHQVRLHFSHIGHPIVADALYGGGESFLLSSIKRRYKRAKGQEEKPLIARPALHARTIAFRPVGAAAPVRVEAPLPDDMQLLLKMLRKYA